MSRLLYRLSYATKFSEERDYQRVRDLSIADRIGLYTRLCRWALSITRRFQVL